MWNTPRSLSNPGVCGQATLRDAQKNQEKKKRKKKHVHVHLIKVLLRHFLVEVCIFSY